MGKKPRPKPKRLAKKLLMIRNALGLSQSEMLKRLEAEDQIDYTAISKYEVGRNEPSLMLLLQYARAAGVHMEDIVDDELELPAKLPGHVKYKGIKRASAARSKKR
jgi:transcriptional regulator with XRE-family HTH domain